MKKIIATLLAVLLALTSLAVFADDAATGNADLADPAVLFGFVTEVNDEYVLVQSDDGILVQANLSEETLLEGSDMAVGDHIHVVYNGMMTRSFPAQVSAQVITNHQLSGVVSELNEEGFILTMDEQPFQVSATAVQLTGIQDGMFATVFYDGRMTRSIPAQVVACHVRGQGITGTVTEMTEEGFTLSIPDSDVIYTVIPMENVLSFVTPEPGMTLTVITSGVATLSLDPIVNAMELLPAPAVQELFDLAGLVTEVGEDYLLIKGEGDQEYQVNLLPETAFEGKEPEVGDYIHVTYNGQTTFSLPPQVAALTIGCYVHQGVVSDIVEGQFMLTTEDGMVIVNTLPEMTEQLLDGETIRVYSNGAMTLSLPAQIAAECIVPISR